MKRVHHFILVFLSVFALNSRTVAAGDEPPPVSIKGKDEASGSLNPKSEPRTPGKFAGTVDSLRQYQTPEWFRNAKFGIWTCWNAYTVPGIGDWYARNMYIQGSDAYNYQVAHYGHPSKVGYKDVIEMWKGENFHPDDLVKLFKYAGAKYCVAMANHHDNFDLWNSKYHQWNAVNHGPHQDIIGRWRKAILAAGLRWGVTTHAERTWSWFQTNKGADATGPLKGVPYDGNDPAFEDLYLPKSEDTNAAHPKNAPVRWRTEWLNRTLDLIHNYKPDLCYVDGGVPFYGDDKGKTGLAMIAEFYNANASWHDGQNEAVMFIKDWGDRPWGYYWDGIATLDRERTHLSEISQEPWQTDTSIGDWTWNRNEQYRSPSEIIYELIDVVSKNGNLLLNVSPKADGTLDDAATKLLTDIGDWMSINGESIYDTRPWVIFGEGPTNFKDPNDAQTHDVAFTSKDIRYTRKEADIYATTLGLPSGRVALRALSSDSPLVTGQPTKVTLLGDNDDLHWSRTAEGLIIDLPKTLPCKIALSFEISGLTTVTNVAPDAMRAFEYRLSTKPPVVADDSGTFLLSAAEARLHGDSIKVESIGDTSGLGYWGNANDSASWEVKFAKPGAYNVSLELGTPDAASEFTVVVGDQQISGKTTNTGGYRKYQTLDLGSVTIKAAGVSTVTIRPTSADSWKPFSLRGIYLQAKP